ncbi:hypothetical protein M404DRAFT_991772 [Pisolithus tinctorius Marx 270]|uniref:Uncharacterized protein n=1 Tax=Pisolithus tinctorius Marx 270 TaxID=870435 RepID=A0A0C3KZW9_PISTI|nr:hypothetical protein M404DRAFT_991772 [Pisolithus tinctorius Marx 270]
MNVRSFSSGTGGAVPVAGPSTGEGYTASVRVDGVSPRMKHIGTNRCCKHVASTHH